METAIHLFADADTLSTAAADALITQIERSVAADRDFSLALAGGRTPRRLYELLATSSRSARLPWSRVQIFFGDERTVAPDHADSNYGMARAALFDHVPIPPQNIHRIEAEDPDPAAAARRYEAALRQYFGTADPPCFDLILLGLGTDGHIASLFPDTAILTETDHLAAAVWVPKLDTWRISLTYPVINHARQVWLLVAGADKAAVVADVLGPAARPGRHPVQRLDPAGTLTWYLDRAAATALGDRV